MSTIAWTLPRRRDVRLPISMETIVAGAAACIVALWFGATTPEAMHWFVLPVTVCALLVGGDAIRWVRGKTGAFDPAGMLGLLGIHLFFLAPLLHVRWDYWMRYVQAPPDWRDWIGMMAVFNCLGLVAYRCARAWFARSSLQLHTERVIDRRRFWTILLAALLIAAATQYWVYSRVGGLLGYVRAYERPGEAFEGYGFTFLISESFPILAFMAFAVSAARRRMLASWWVLVPVLIAFFLLKVVFGGLRGSRSNTVWGLFWAIGIIHLWIRPLPRRALIAAIPALAAFMFGYGLYKAAGLDGLRALLEPARAVQIAQRSGRTLHSTLLGDLGRADVQAYVLYRIETGAAQDLAWGRTYIGDLAILIPRSLLPNRPPPKAKDGTDILYGRGTYDRGRSSKRVFGLAGEAMLNVGPAGVPIVFLLWGAFVGVLRRFYYGLRRGDARILLLPLLLNLALILLIGDADNAVFFLVKEGALPFLIVLLGSRSIPLRPATEARP